MTRSELTRVVEWAAAEGWNPGLYDIDCFYAVDKRGFLIGLLDGEPIASISVVKYGETFGFLGFYIVRPDYRGQGYGWRIWQAGLAHLEGRTVGLDGVVEQQKNYIKSGFELAHRNIRYEGIEAADDDVQLNEKTSHEYKLVPLSSLSIETVMDYDRGIFLSDRADFLHCWINSPHHQAIGLTRQGRLSGYGVLRPCQQGYKIGPLFADSPQYAEALFLVLKARVKSGSPFYLDVPNANAAAVAIAQKYQMTSVFETARMYRQKAPDLPLNRIFGITTFELG